MNNTNTHTIQVDRPQIAVAIDPQLALALGIVVSRRAIHRRVVQDAINAAGAVNPHGVNEAVSGILCLSAGVVLAMLACALWASGAELSLAEHVELMLRPLERIDATLLLPLGLHIETRWLVQGVAGGLALCVPALALMLR